MYTIELPEFEHSEPIPLPDEDFDYLKTQHQTHLSVEQVGDRVILHANHHVGFIQLSEAVIYLKPKVPDENLLFIISYLYDQVELLEDIDFRQEEANTILDLMIALLLERTSRLIKRGVHRRYVKKVENIPRVRGKIIPARNLFYFDKLWCSYEDLSHSVAENMILKATLRTILSQNTKDFLKEQTKILIKLLSEIKDIELTTTYFHTLTYSRLNANYRNILHLCYLIFQHYSVYQAQGDTTFQGFLIDMNAVFEEFVRKYLQDHLPGETISRRRISDWAHGGESAFLPVMEPDIVIKDKLVLDVKYYKNIFGSRGKFHSHNLYQILSYMNVLGLSGMLLYPQSESSGSVEESYRIDGKTFHLKTLNMQGTYHEFVNELRSLIEYVREYIRFEY